MVGNLGIAQGLVNMPVFALLCKELHYPSYVGLRFPTLAPRPAAPHVPRETPDELVAHLAQRLTDVDSAHIAKIHAAARQLLEIENAHRKTQGLPPITARWAPQEVARLKLVK